MLFSPRNRQRILNMTKELDKNYVPRSPRFTVADPSGVGVTITRTEQSDHQPLQAELLDVSQHGAKLRVPVNLRFEEAVQLKIEVANSDLGYSGVASVRHIRSLDEESWIIGCAIAPPLSDEAFSYLATTAGKERRRFRRLSISADAIVRRQAQVVGIEATLHNLSSGGICFSSSEHYEIGEMVKIAVDDPEGNQRIVDARICWHVDSDDGSIAGCKFASKSSYAELCACLTEQPAVASYAHPGGEPTSKLVLTTAVLAMFVPPMMTLMMQAKKVSAKANVTPPVAEATAQKEEVVPAHAAESVEPENQSPELLKEFIAESRAVEVEQPHDEPVAEARPLREWIDNTGKHRTLAELVEVTSEYIVLKKSNGRQSKVPLRRLSEADREYVRDWQSQ